MSFHYQRFFREERCMVEAVGRLTQSFKNMFYGLRNYVFAWALRNKIGPEKLSCFYGNSNVNHSLSFTDNK